MSRRFGFRISPSSSPGESPGKRLLEGYASASLNLSYGLVPKEVRHYGHVCIARMVEARNPKSCLKRLQQGKAVVVRAALDARAVMVRLDRENNSVLVLRWE